ncbi:IS607 family element RNA-guided endonuclease TnpB [Rhodococcus sp. IEGM 1305]|uniref:IS607 family element RNA-guided endonuclease TnpB n=1 Tax=Rhodococcus sp. IEGM 1305 TaxID=3047092 RepID=UPI0024B687CD|nr:IS607 family element RNA-guided endonuclease TnpB [Rhodococcus sp. IEGM 1305]MDI9953133.1 IS607 family element RNA-guided endonuclease TnpB [Rhodococcus sp. IEGM 1305]
MTPTAALVNPVAPVTAPTVDETVDQAAESCRSVIRAFVYVLDPTPEQASVLRSHCGAQRFAYNWALSRVKANVDQRTAERSYEIPDSELTPPVSWSAYSLRKHWNTVKNDIAVNTDTGQVWWPENSKEAYSSGIANCAAALSNWSDARSGKRKGTMGFPRFKGKRALLSCRFTTGSFGLVTDGGDRRHIQLPRIGAVRSAESTRKLARKVAAGTARIRSATLSYRRGRWQVSFSVETTLPTRALPPTGTAVGNRGVVGVDVGVKHLAVLSTGEMIENPKHARKQAKQLRQLGRRASRRVGPDRRTGQQPSRRWLRTQEQIRTVHARIADSRRDHLHKLTTRLVRDFDTVVVEDLNIAGMTRSGGAYKRGLNRALNDAGLAEIRRQLMYKTERTGTGLHVADRWYPSSKTCSNCQAVKAKLPLKVRVFTCDACGFRADRDHNAALNLAALAAAVDDGASSASCGRDVKDARQKPAIRPAARRADGIAAGTPHRGERGRGNPDTHAECTTTTLSMNGPLLSDPACTLSP